MAFYNTFANYVGDDSTTDFAIPFSYIKEEDVVVTRQGGAVSYIFLDPQTIRLSAPLAAGDSLKIERDTSLSEKAVVFNNGSPFTAGQMNTGFNQLFNALQEASDTAGSQLGITNDGNWDALSRRITNTDDPVDAQDVATKNYVDTGVNSSVIAAAASAAAASSSASNASSSAASAATQASNALTYASNASTSASAASTQASNALASANSASSANSSALAAQSAAEAARDAALAAYDNFDDRYLGAKASDPTLDNDGAALIAGSLYFNTTSNTMKIYTGSAWVAAYVSGTDYVTKTGDTMTGTLNLPANGLTVGTDQLKVSSGNVGIGTSSPDQKLSVVGRVLASTTEADATSKQGLYGVKHYTNAEEPFYGIHHFATPSTNALYLGGGVSVGNAATQIRFYTAANTTTVTGTERIRIDSAGNVGIGTSSPAKKLSMDIGMSNNGIQILSTVEGAVGGAIPVFEGIGYRGDGNQKFSTRFAGAFRRSDGTAITSGTHLGSVLFGGQYGTDTTYQSGKVLYAASIHGVAEGSFTDATTMPTGITFRTGSTGEDAYGINTNYGTEQMRITSAGNVGIGTSSPAQKLSVAGTVESTTGGFKFPDGTTQTTAASGGIQPGDTLVTARTLSSPEFITESGRYLKTDYPLIGSMSAFNESGTNWSDTSATVSLTYGLAYGNGTWLACSGTTNVQRSTDGGNNWSTVTTPFTFGDVAYGNGVWIARFYTTGSSQLSRSTNDGLTWSAVGPSVDNYTAMHYANGVWIAIATGGRIYRSTDDGATWSSVTSGTTSNLYSVHYGNGVWIAVGFTSTILRSTDNGVSWTTIPPGASTHFYGVSYGNGVWIVIINGGTFWRSTDDGLTWEPQYLSTTCQNAAYGNGTWLLVGSYSLFKSNDNGKTFDLAGTASGSPTYRTTAYGGGVWMSRVFTGSTHKVIRSVDDATKFWVPPSRINLYTGE